MPPSVNQEINVNINALVKRIQDVREFVSLLKSLRTSGSGPVILDQKISDNAKASIGDVSQLKSSIDNLAAAVEKLDDSKVSRLAKAFQFLSNASNVLGHIKGTIEGVQFILGLGDKFPAVGAKLSSTFNGATTAIGSFFRAAKEKGASAIAAVKENVSGLASNLPGVATAAVTAAGGLGVLATAAIAVSIALVAVTAIVVALKALSSVIGFIWDSVKATTELGSQLHDLSLQTGVSVETLSALKVAADQSSSSIEEVAKGVGKFNKLIGEAASGSKEATATLTEFGLKPQEALKDQEAALAKVFKRIIDLPPGIQRSIAAQQAFGKSGAALVATIETTNGDLEALKKKAIELGVAFDEKAAAGADEFGDKLTEIKGIIQGIGLSIGKELIPDLLKLARVFKNELADGVTVFGAALKIMAFEIRAVTGAITVLVAAKRWLLAGHGPTVVSAESDNTGGELRGNFGDTSFGAVFQGVLDEANTPSPSSDSKREDLKFPKAGGKKKTPTSPVDTSESQFALDKAIAEARFNQIKDSLDRENKLVQERYDERRLTIADYYAEQLRIQDEAIEAEIIKLTKELNAEQFKLATALQKIAADRKSGNIKTDAEAEAKATNELNKTKAASVTLSQQINKLIADRVALPHDIELKEKADTDALNASLQKQIDALDTLRGIGPLVQVRQQIAEIDKLIEQFADNPGMVRFLEEWRELLGIMGQLEAITTRLQKQNQVNDARIATLQTQGNQNVITRLLADQKIVALKKEELKATEAALAEALALGAKDQDSLARIEQLRASIAQLKIETRSFQQQLKDTAIDNLASGFETFIVTIGKGIKSFQDLKKAALDFLNSFLQGLLQVIAHKLALDLVAGLLGTGKTNTTGAADNGALGRLASFFSGLFGGKKAAGDMMSARPGGQLIQVAEAGHDELVVSTDPRYAVRTSALLANFIRRTGIVPSFGAGGFARSVANSLTTIPRLAAGGFIPAGPNLAFAGAAAGGHQLPPKVIIAVSEEEIANASMSSAGEKVWLYHFNKNRRAIFGR